MYIKKKNIESSPKTAQLAMTMKMKCYILGGLKFKSPIMLHFVEINMPINLKICDIIFYDFSHHISQLLKYNIKMLILILSCIIKYINK